MRAARVLQLLFFAFVTTTSAHACSCICPTPACSAYFAHDIIFRGTVLEKKQELDPPEEVTNPDGTKSFLSGTGKYKVVFSVSEGFRGSEAGKQITILTNLQGSACGFPFQVGSEYLVLADSGRSSGLPETSICSGTRAIHELVTDTDLQWLRAYPTSSSGTRIFGSVILPDRKPAVSTTVSVTGIASARATTDSGGNYSMSGLPPGDYKVQTEAPPGFTPYGDPRPIKVMDRGCAQVDFLLNYDGRVSGRVTDADGKRPANLYVNLASARASTEGGNTNAGFAVTKGDGSYQIDHVQPGEYLVEVNRTAPPGTPYPQQFYGGNAFTGKAITVTASATVENIDVVMPRAWEVVTIPVRVVQANGKPAGKVAVEAVDEAYSNRPTQGVMTGEDGTEKLPLFEGHSYRITALSWGGEQILCSQTQRLTVQPNMKQLAFRLAATTGDCRIY